MDIGWGILKLNLNITQLTTVRKEPDLVDYIEWYDTHWQSWYNTKYMSTDITRGCLYVMQPLHADMETGCIYKADVPSYWDINCQGIDGLLYTGDYNNNPQVYLYGDTDDHYCSLVLICRYQYTRESRQSL